MLEQLKKWFPEICPSVDFCSLRYERRDEETLSVQRGVPDPVELSEDRGAMITVMHRGGMGYAATNDLTKEGLKNAAQEAEEWAKNSEGKLVFDFSKVSLSHEQDTFKTPVQKDWASVSRADKLHSLKEQCQRLKIDDRIVDTKAALWYTDHETLYLTNHGGNIRQNYALLVPMLTATANQSTESQTRTFGGHSSARQSGLEFLDEIHFSDLPKKISQEALDLLAAENCPTGNMELLLAPDQMILQIHESVGHPLELDRILGDERNYAGTSFVKPSDFGSFQYGSNLMNITFDPTIENELSTFGYDDEGAKAEKTFLIKDGILLRGLGGSISQSRMSKDGMAISRACSWNRPPIDRIANLNLEPGDSSLEDMISGIEKGVYMKTNCSWSIDDSRNKFQFGCEWGQLIENGKLTKLVKNSNYRGISSSFWRNLIKVGNQSTFDVMGTPFCGKGEPNQVIRVGHASPAALFHNVQVFGGV